MLSKFLVNDLNVEENVEKRGGRKKERSEREREREAYEIRDNMLCYRSDCLKSKLCFLFVGRETGSCARCSHSLYAALSRFSVFVERARESNRKIAG